MEILYNALPWDHLLLIEANMESASVSFITPAFNVGAAHERAVCQTVKIGNFASVVLVEM